MGDTVLRLDLTDLPADRVARVTSDLDAAVYHVARGHGEWYRVHRAPGSDSTGYRYDGRWVDLYALECLSSIGEDPVDWLLSVGRRHRWFFIYGGRYDDAFWILSRAVTRIDLIDRADAPAGLD